VQGETVSTIYKICDQSSWRQAESEKRLLGTPADVRDGFIHFSTAAQLAATAAKHFAGAEDLVLVAIDAGKLDGALKWEVSRDGELFPHLYAPLPFAAVLWARPLADEVDGHRYLPEIQS
jgi:uncharacterized protein (DUF952 family)